MRLPLFPPKLAHEFTHEHGACLACHVCWLPGFSRRRQTVARAG